ncbi:MAG: GNAT family N-acetyltransferase [Nocardioides sp.]
MDHPQIRVGPARDQDAYLRSDHTVWFDEVGEDATDQQLLGVPERYRFAAETDDAEPGTYPGIYGVRPMTLSVPGHEGGVRRVPVAGLTWVGVHPDHRRRGVLTAMMRHHLEHVRDEPGTHLSALHASEPAIYGRYGYGLASLEQTVTLSRGTRLTAPHLDVAASTLTTRLATITDDEMATRSHACWEHCAESAVGTIVGDLDFFERLCIETAEDLRGKESMRMLFAKRDGLDVGLAAFRREHKWERARPGGELTVHALAGDPAARLALVRRLVDFDRMGSVKIFGLGAEDPLLDWFGGPRGASDVATYDSLWVRLVDLPEALTARAYAAPCDVVLDVADTSAPWNAGRWRFHVDAAGTAVVERTGEDPDLRLPVEALGACYLGGVSPVALASAGLIEEVRPRTARALWHAVRTDQRPGAALGF